MALGVIASAQPKLRADNIDAVVAAMTLREKATLVMGGGWGSLIEGMGVPSVKNHRVPGAAGESRAATRICPRPTISRSPNGATT